MGPAASAAGGKRRGDRCLSPRSPQSDVQEKLLADIDAQLLRLESGETDGSTEPTPSRDRSDGHNPAE